MRPEEIELAPWHRYNWTGRFMSFDGCEAGDFKLDDVDRVVLFGTTNGTDWDGESAAVVQLQDGRFVSWECDWGPTGNGFCCDAYGGEADVFFAWTQELAVKALSERARELLR